MSDRLELTVHDFLIEGRDEAKSHVLLEIAAPAPEELVSHGHFFALAELGGASPKTIQLVRAWIEFAIEKYFASTPTNIESHFENILNQLNTQSSVYLRQHANEQIQIVVAAVCGTSLFMAFHGKPAVLLLYRKQEAWQSMDLSEGYSEGTAPPQLFGNIVSGTLRPDDRLLLATSRVTEFFTADRLTKISEGKTIEEVAVHMERVITEMSSDFSFGGAWIKLTRVIAHEEIPAATIQLNTQTPIIHERRSQTSITELMRKTKSTAELLAPPIISIPRDKIITSLLQLARKGLVKSGIGVASISRSALAFVSTKSKVLISKKISPTIKNITPPKIKMFGMAEKHISKSFLVQPFIKKNKLAIGIGLLAITILIAGLLYAHHRTIAAQKVAVILAATNDRLTAANSAFTFQKESDAQNLLVEATTQFNTLTPSERTSEAARVTASALVDMKNKVFHINSVQPELIAQVPHIKNIFIANGLPTFLVDHGHVQAIKSSKVVDVGTTPDGTGDFAFIDEDNKRIIITTGNVPKHFFGMPLSGGKTTDILLTPLPEHTRFDAAVFYSGRAYIYDNTATMLYRYDKVDDGYGSGKKWIVDGTKPVSITKISADNSLWLLTQQGTILKFTAGKLQPFHFTNITPEISHVATVLTGMSGTVVYFLDTENARLVVTDRDGKLTHQYTFPSNTRLTSIAIDKNETAAFGVTDDGRVMKFPLTK